MCVFIISSSSSPVGLTWSGDCSGVGGTVQFSDTLLCGEVVISGVIGEVISEVISE